MPCPIRSLQIVKAALLICHKCANFCIGHLCHVCVWHFGILLKQYFLKWRRRDETFRIVGSKSSSLKSQESLKMRKGIKWEVQENIFALKYQEKARQEDHKLDYGCGKSHLTLKRSPCLVSKLPGCNMVIDEF